MDYETIEHYLHDDLSSEERASFEQAMATDRELADKVAVYRNIEATMKGGLAAQAGEAALRQQLEALGKQHFGTTTATHSASVVDIKRKRRPYYWIAGVAAALLAFVLIRPLIKNEAVTDTDEWYQQYANYTINVNKERSSDGQPISSLKVKADSLLKLNKFDSALKVLDALSVTDSSPAILLAKGACYTETNDSAKANQIFTLVQASNKDYSDQAAWYKALLYLKYKDVASCRTTLLTISKGSNFEDSAAELLKKLPKT